MPWAVVAALAVVLILGTLWHFMRPVETKAQPVVRLDVDLNRRIM